MVRSVNERAGGVCNHPPDPMLFSFSFLLAFNGWQRTCFLFSFGVACVHGRQILLTDEVLPNVIKIEMHFSVLFFVTLLRKKYKLPYSLVIQFICLLNSVSRNSGVVSLKRNYNNDNNDNF